MAKLFLIQKLFSQYRASAGYTWLILVFPAWSHAQPFDRNFLAGFSPADVRAALIPQEQWKPFPRTTADWDNVLADSIQKKLISEAETQLGVPFASFPASLILEYKKTGKRTGYEDVSFKKREQLYALVLAESMEQKGRFLPDIVDGIWSTCEETFWGIPAHLYMQNQADAALPDAADPAVDIFAGEAAVILGLADYFLGEKLDSISPLLRQRIYYEVDRRILTPMETQSARYWYMQKGSKTSPVNNWNPWVVSCWMSSLLLLEKQPERRVRELHHAMLTLDNYLNWLGDDGAIDEGPSYWSGAIGRLFDALDMLASASGRKLTIFKEPLVQKAASYIYKVHIAGNYFINTADASPTIDQDGLLLFRIGRSVNDPVMQRFGSWAYHHLTRNHLSKDFSKTRRIWNLLAVQSCRSDTGSVPELSDVWLPGIQLMAARRPNGFFVASHGGHNAESHNHNDVGDFVVYADGQPVIIDVGFGTYTAKTFSKERYTLWYNNSAYHNLPVINGATQEAGAEFAAENVICKQSESKATLHMDITNAYPPGAEINSWIRTVTLDRNKNSLSVKDDFDLKKWSKPLTQTFMTVCRSRVDQPGKIIFEIPQKKPVTLRYDPDVWNVTQERMPTDAPDEKRVAENWGHRSIYRILLTQKNRKTKGSLLYQFTQ